VINESRECATSCGDSRSRQDVVLHNSKTTPHNNHDIDIPYPRDMAVRASDVILILVTIVFPPAGAFFVAGCGCDLLINILLTL